MIRGVDKRRFERLVEEGIAAIPARFRARLGPVVFAVEDASPRNELLGLFEGPVLAELGLDAHVPPKITIFRREHLAEANNERHLKQLVAETVWHEVAHFLGMDEAEVTAAERRRQRP